MYIKDIKVECHAATLVSIFIPSCQWHDLVLSYLKNKPVIKFDHCNNINPIFQLF